MEKQENEGGFLICTTDMPHGYRVKEIKGVVWGSEVRTKSFSSNLAATFRTFQGGEVPELTNLVRQARVDTVKRMVANAKRMGANAVIGMKLSATVVRTNIAEFIAYGTAAIVEKEHGKG